jgi:hypothetical protein
MAALTFYLPTVIFISLVGGFLPLLRELSQKGLGLLLSFSAGVLLGAVFFHMLPETGRVLSDNMGWPVLTGFLLIFAMERFVFVHACEERDCDIHQMGLPAFLGIALHSLLDGIALGAGLILPQLGPVVLLAVIVHKMPDSMSISSILLAAGWNRRKVSDSQLALFSDDAHRRPARLFIFPLACAGRCRLRHRHFCRDFFGHRHGRYPAASTSHSTAESGNAGFPASRIDRKLVGQTPFFLATG